MSLSWKAPHSLVFSSVLRVCGSTSKQNLGLSVFLPQEKLIIKFHVHILNAYQYITEGR